MTTSIYRRATPRQALVMRMIEGAARNAAHAHQDWKFDPRLVTSIAKRAAGTLTAQWPDVLAAPREPSDRCDGQFRSVSASRSGRVGNRDGKSVPRLARHAGAASNWVRRGPSAAYVSRLIGAMAKQARVAGLSERETALIDALRLIDALVAHEGELPRRWVLPEIGA